GLVGVAVEKMPEDRMLSHYAADMKRRLSAFFGDERQGRARGDAGARPRFAERRGGPFPARGPRIGVAEAPLAPQMKLGRKARTPAREIMILSIELSHPALIE